MRRMECTPKTLSTLYGPARNSVIGETIIALTCDPHLDFRVAEAFEITGILGREAPPLRYLRQAGECCGSVHARPMRAIVQTALQDGPMIVAHLILRRTRSCAPIANFSFWA